MATYFILIETTGAVTIELADPIVNNQATYDYLCASVRGNIDVVSTPRFDFWVNDEGLFAEDVNHLLTSAIRNEVGTIYQRYHGDAVVAKADEYGSTISLTMDEVAYLLGRLLPAMEEVHA